MEEKNLYEKYESFFGKINQKNLENIISYMRLCEKIGAISLINKSFNFLIKSDESLSLYVKKAKGYYRFLSDKNVYTLKYDTEKYKKVFRSEKTTEDFLNDFVIFTFAFGNKNRKQLRLSHSVNYNKFILNLFKEAFFMKIKFNYEEVYLNIDYIDIEDFESFGFLDFGKINVLKIELCDVINKGKELLKLFKFENLSSFNIKFEKFTCEEIDFLKKIRFDKLENLEINYDKFMEFDEKIVLSFRELKLPNVRFITINGNKFVIDTTNSLMEIYFDNKFFK